MNQIQQGGDLMGKYGYSKNGTYVSVYRWPYLSRTLMALWHSLQMFLRRWHKEKELEVNALSQEKPTQYGDEYQEAPLTGEWEKIFAGVQESITNRIKNLLAQLRTAPRFDKHDPKSLLLWLKPQADNTDKIVLDAVSSWHKVNDIQFFRSYMERPIFRDFQKVFAETFRKDFDSVPLSRRELVWDLLDPESSRIPNALFDVMYIASTIATAPDNERLQKRGAEALDVAELYLKGWFPFGFSGDSVLVLVK